MKFIFSTGSIYSYGLDRAYQFAARAGFDGVEILVDPRYDTWQPEYLETLRERYGIPIVAIHSPFFPIPGWEPGPVHAIERSVRLAERLGASVVVHHLPQRVGHATLAAGRRSIRLPLPGWEPEKAYREWLEREYAAFQQGTEVRLCMENMPAFLLSRRRVSVHHWNTVAEITRFPSLTMDTTHLGTWGLEPVEVYQQWGEQVRHVHLSNFDGREHRRPERGRLDLKGLVRMLHRDGYDGAICFELHPDAVEAGASDERVVELMAGSLRHCRAWISGE